MQSLALIELIGTAVKQYPDILKTCSVLLSDITEKLSALHQPPPTKPDDETHLPMHEKNSKVISNSEGSDVVHLTSRTFHTNFSSIIGCNNAKTSLFENVILPFTLAGDQKSTLFKGNIRC
jgi:hypothetical protein